MNAILSIFLADIQLHCSSKQESEDKKMTVITPIPTTTGRPQGLKHPKDKNPPIHNILQLHRVYYLPYDTQHYLPCLIIDLDIKHMSVRIRNVVILASVSLRSDDRGRPFCLSKLIFGQIYIQSKYECRASFSTNLLIQEQKRVNQFLQISLISCILKANSRLVRQIVQCGIRSHNYTNSVSVWKMNANNVSLCDTRYKKIALLLYENLYRVCMYNNSLLR